MAQAGNVAVPGAAREHFVPSSAVPSESASTSAGPIAKVCRPVKRKTSSRFKERVSSSALAGGDAGGDERDGGAAVLEGGIGIGMVDVGRGASAGSPVRPQRRVSWGSASGTQTSTTIDSAVFAEEDGAGNNNGLHARRLSPKREGVGSGSSSGGWNRHELPS